MSDTLYSIKEQTLVDIGDALRRRHGETEWVEAPVPVIEVSKTKNATGFDSWSGGCEGANANFYDVVTITGATTIKVKMAYHLMYYSIESWRQYVYVASGSHDAATFPSDALKYMGADNGNLGKDEPIKIVELEFSNIDSVTFYWRGSTAGDGGSFLGYYAEVTGYDENGEVVTELASVEIPRVYTSAEMAQAIDDIPPAPPEEAFLITGDCSYRFAYGGWDWFIEEYGKNVSTEDISNVQYMFSSSLLNTIPFEINCKSDTKINMSYLFGNCSRLTTIPKINGCQPDDMDNMFYGCYLIRHLPNDIASWFDWTKVDGATSAYDHTRTNTLQYCFSLRSFPMEFMNHVNPISTYSGSIFKGCFSSCYVLDEVVDFPILYTSTWTSNGFGSMFTSCFRLKNITFATPNGQPYTMKWKSQTIDLTASVGYGGSVSSRNYVLDYNSGITADKEVTDDASYQALKNDPDWFTCNIAYSRYNHDSAVATINSLPDTSAYLASAGGSNTLKFKGASGELTDGGAINTLTAEEIAVATSRGWTVTLS